MPTKNRGGARSVGFGEGKNQAMAAMGFFLPRFPNTLGFFRYVYPHLEQTLGFFFGLSGIFSTIFWERWACRLQPCRCNWQATSVKKYFGFDLGNRVATKDCQLHWRISASDFCSPKKVCEKWFQLGTSMVFANLCFRAAAGEAAKSKKD